MRPASSPTQQELREQVILFSLRLGDTMRNLICWCPQTQRPIDLQLFTDYVTLARIWSSSVSVLRRRAESALWRAIASSQVETEERASKEPAWRQTSRNTSLKRSSAKVSSPTRRRSQRYSATRCLQKSVRMASWSPPAIRLISISSEEVSRAATCASGGGRSHTGADHVVHGAIPFNHVPHIKLVRTGKIPTPICDQLTVRRGVTTVNKL